MKRIKDVKKIVGIRPIKKFEKFEFSNNKLEKKDESGKVEK